MVEHFLNTERPGSVLTNRRRSTSSDIARYRTISDDTYLPMTRRKGGRNGAVGKGKEADMTYFYPNFASMSSEWPSSMAASKSAERKGYLGIDEAVSCLPSPTSAKHS